jgi:predicted flap endonuclease-1-like 5' DNA nuclease
METFDPQLETYNPSLIDPGYRLPDDFPFVEGEEETPDFEAMKVQPGDIITAATMNGLIDAVKQLHSRVQTLAEGAKKSQVGSILPRGVTEVEGIGREEAQKLAQSGIVSLQDLGTAKPSVVKDTLGVKKDEAERIVSDAFTLTGRQSGQPLTDIAEIGAQEASRLFGANIRTLQDLSAADTGTVRKTLNLDADTAETLISQAKTLSGG